VPVPLLPILVNQVPDNGDDGGILIVLLNFQGFLLREKILCLSEFNGRLHHTGFTTSFGNKSSRKLSDSLTEHKIPFLFSLVFGSGFVFAGVHIALSFLLTAVLTHRGGIVPFQPVCWHARHG